MRKRMNNIFTSADVMYYLREIVVRLRQHASYNDGLSTDTYSAFESASKFVTFITVLLFYGGVLMLIVVCMLCRIAALVDGCMFVSPLHIQSVAAMVLRHRMIIKSTSHKHTVDSIIADVLAHIPVPV